MKYFLALLFILASSSLANGDVIINEISAASSERLLRFDEQGRPRVGAGPGWMDPDFNASHWKDGEQPFGFGNDKATNLQDEMDGVTPSLYLRKTFSVTEAQAAMEEAFRFQAKFDDGFVAYVNGVEIARGNLGRENGFVYADQSSLNKISPANAAKIHRIEGPLAHEILVPGENVLAIQVHNTVPQALNENTTAIDRSLHFEMELFIGLGIFAGGSNIAIANEDDRFQYFVGVVEPSGGLFDPQLIGTPLFEVGFSDWIELYNSGDEAVDLAGWSLSDDKDNPKLWQFPEGASISPQGYLVVLADDRTDGTAGTYLHAGFKLSADGDDVRLYNAAGELVSELDNFPKQDPFHTYGRSVDAETFVYFETPTPGAANAMIGLTDVVKSPKFSVDRGFHEGEFELALSSNTEGAEIRYTIDGSLPQPWNGAVYTAPFMVEPVDEKTGVVVRARAFKDGFIPSKTKTHTYLIDQNPALQTLPVLSLAADAGYAFYKPHGVMAIEGGIGLGESWEAEDIQDYYMPYMHGRSVERLASVELIYPDEDGGQVQLEAGVRLAASTFSRGRFRISQPDSSPWTSHPSEKPSFNVFFRADYGDPSLDFPLVKNYPVRTFDQLRLRAGKNDIRNPWIKDELARRLFGDTGQLSSQGIQSALYVNGEYKGYYNTVARLRTTLFQEFYGSSQPWDIKHIRSWTEGDDTQYETAVALLEKDMEDLGNYQAALSMVDPVNIADYLIVNAYGATWDWPHNNFVVARERSETGKWRMYMWDAEGAFGHSDHGITRNVIDVDILKNSRAGPTNDNIVELSKLLLGSPEFRLLFADRVQKHFFTPDGALTEANITRRLEELSDEIDPLMRFTGNNNINLGTIRIWTDKREDEIFKRGKHFEELGIWTRTQVPKFRQHGGTVPTDFELKLTAGSIFAPQPGDILYTTDGSDPRLMGGEVNPTAAIYETGSPILLTQSATVKTRVKNGSDWSALNEAAFLVDLTPANPDTFVISEIMYDPATPTEAEAAAGFSKSDFEYVEIYNASDTAIDLTNLSFNEGIRFDFNSGSLLSLAPRTYAVLVADQEAFQSRYGTGAIIAGEFGKSLNNDGETLEVTTDRLVSIKQVTYADRDPWPAEADGDGYSIELQTPNDNPNPSEATNWAASTQLGGSPGAASGETTGEGPGRGYTAWQTAQFTVEERENALISGPNADPDGDSQTNLLEYAAGTLPKDVHSTSTLQVAHDEAGLLTITFPQGPAVLEVTDVLEWSEDLRSFEALSGFTSSELVKPDGTKQITYKSTAPLDGATRYLRRRVHQP